MYKFKADGLEDKLKYSKPFSFFESVREKFQKAGKDNFLSLEEAETASSEVKDDSYNVQKKLTKEIYENQVDYMSKIYSKLHKANVKEEKKKELVTESFNRNVFEEKATKDLIAIKELLEFTFEGKDAAFDRLKDEIFEMTKDALNDVINLYQETDVKPRYISLALAHKELSESEIFNIYKRHLKEHLQENYMKPILSGKIEELEETESIKKFAKFLTENGIDTDLDALIAYVPFENQLKDFFENMFIPEGAKYKINLFMESQDDVYYEFFDKNAKILTESIEEKIGKIVSLIAPFLFDKVVDGVDDMEVDPTKLAGVSIACKRVNDGPMACTVSKKEDEDSEGSEDSDTDDIPMDGVPSNEEINEKLDEDEIDENPEELSDDAEEELKDEMEAEMIDDVVEGESEDEIEKEAEEEGETVEEEKKEKEELKESTTLDAPKELTEAQKKEIEKEEVQNDEASNFSLENPEAPVEK